MANDTKSMDPADAPRPADAPDVFVSFCTADGEVVDKVVACLRAENFKVFFSKQDLRPSARAWEDTVHEKLEQCHVVLGLQSPAAWESDEVRPEWAFGREQDKLIFAIIREVPKQKQNYRYRQPQVVNLCSWAQDPAAAEFQSLVTGLRDMMKDVGDRPAGFDSRTPVSKDVMLSPNIGAGAAPTPAAAPVQANAPVVQQADESDLQTAIGPVELGVSARDWSVKDLAPIADKALAIGEATLRQAAQSRQSEAQTALAFAHILGRGGVARDDGAAGRWLQKAADAGFARAKAELAMLIASQRFGVRDIARIDALSAEAANAGNARAKTLRGLIRLSGVRIAITVPDAVKLFEAAARDGDNLGAAYYGWSLLEGRGVKRDRVKAATVLRDAAQAGEPRAMVNYGMMHAFGRGVRQDLSKAGHWFRESALRGDPWGEFYFGWANELGVGIPRDTNEARKWYRRAADHGDVDAMFYLGRMMLEGRGGVADPREAAVFLERAADHGEERAAATLGAMYEEGRGVPKDFAKAAEWYKRAADEEDPNGLWKLGVLYEWGRGVQKDLEQAKKLFRRAALNARDREFLRMALEKLKFYGVTLRAST